jgi:hypothetical protein
MLIVLLLALGVIAPVAWFIGSVLPGIPRSNADFEWLDV